MVNWGRSVTVAQNSRQEYVRSKYRYKFVNLEHRRDKEVAQSPSVKPTFVHSDHMTRTYSMSSEHALLDQEIHDLRVEVGHLRWGLHQRVHIRKHKNPSPSPSSSSRDKRNYRWRTRSPWSSVHEAPFHSLGGEWHPRRRNRTPPQGLWGVVPWAGPYARPLSHHFPDISRMPSFSVISPNQRS